MSKMFDGVLHLSCEEMAENHEGSSQGWRRQARLKKVPAIKYRNKWYFNPDKVLEASIRENGYGDKGLNNATKQGAEADFMSDFE